MKEISLLTYLKLRENLNGRELDNSTKMTIGRVKNKFPNIHRLIEEIFENSIPRLNVREFIQLYTKNDVDSINVLPEEIDKILNISKVYITLDEYYKLMNEVEENKETKFLGITIDEKDTEIKNRVKAIQELLNVCKFSLKLNEFKKLREVSKNKEVNFYAPQKNGETEMKFTSEALQAQKILNASCINLKMDEYKQVLIKSFEEVKGDFPDFNGNIIMVKTSNAELATEILEKSYIVISSLGEYILLNDQVTSALELSENLKLDRETIEDTNIFAQYVLKGNLLFDFGYKEKISTKEIYRGTLKEQEDTMGKLLEERDRFDFQYGVLTPKIDNNHID